MASLKSFLEGVKILQQYIPESEFEMAAEHDIIYVGPEGSADEENELESKYNTSEMLTASEKKKLDDLGGWHVDSQFRCWAFFT